MQRLTRQPTLRNQISLATGVHIGSVLAPAKDSTSALFNRARSAPPGSNLMNGSGVKDRRGATMYVARVRTGGDRTNETDSSGIFLFNLWIHLPTQMPFPVGALLGCVSRRPSKRFLLMPP